MSRANAKTYPSMRSGGLYKALNALYALEPFKLGQEQLGSFFDQAALKRFPATSVIFRQNDFVTHLYIVKEGRVTLYQLTAGGKRIVTRQILKGQAFGMIMVLCQIKSPYFAEATEDSKINVVSREEVISLLQREPDIALRLLEIFCKRLMFFRKLVDDLVIEAFYSPVRRRLAHFLLLNTDDSGLLTGITHEEIGDTLGAVRQTVTAALNLMQEEGLIQTGHKKIQVVNRPGLEEIVQTPEGSEALL